MARYIARKPFAILTMGGSTMFVEGQEVPEAIAKAYPHNIVGMAEREKPLEYNPNLKVRLTKKEIGKMDEVSMLQWLKQFHPGSVPSGDAKKDELAEIILNLND